MNEIIYTLKEAADLLKVKPRTLMNWEKRGKITFIYLPVGNAIRITQAEIDKILTPEEKPEGA